MEEIVKEVSISNNDTDKFNRLVNELSKSLKSLKPVANIKVSYINKIITIKTKSKYENKDEKLTYDKF